MNVFNFSNYLKSRAVSNKITKRTEIKNEILLDIATQLMCDKRTKGYISSLDIIMAKTKARGSYYT